MMLGGVVFVIRYDDSALKIFGFVNLFCARAVALAVTRIIFFAVVFLFQITMKCAVWLSSLY
jgi:hypothetical protein